MSRSRVGVADTGSADRGRRFGVTGVRFSYFEFTALGFEGLGFRA